MILMMIVLRKHVRIALADRLLALVDREAYRLEKHHQKTEDERENEKEAKAIAEVEVIAQSKTGLRRSDLEEEAEQSVFYFIQIQIKS